MTWQPPDEARFRRGIPGWAIFFAIAGSISAGLGFDQHDMFYVALPLYLLAIVVWVFTPSSLTLRFHADGIEDRWSGTRFAYQDITYLRLAKRVLFDESTVAKWPEMVIGHRHGCLRLPRGSAMDRVDLYHYLLAKSTLLDPPSILPGRLREVYEREVLDFGAAQVLASSGRTVDPREAPRARIFLAIALVFLVAWLAAWAGNANKELITAYAVIGGFMLVFGVLFLPIFWGHRRALRKLRATCGIVISPRGLTVESPALKGVLTWAELRGVTVVNRTNALLSGLLLKVEGSQFLIGDHYTCPLTEIHRRIKANLAHEGR